MKRTAISLHKNMVLKRVKNSLLSSGQDLPSRYIVAALLENSVYTKTVQKYSVFLSKRKVLIHIVINGFFTYLKGDFSNHVYLKDVHHLENFNVVNSPANWASELLNYIKYFSTFKLIVIPTMFNLKHLYLI